MISRAETILTGVCASSNSRWDERTRMILTDSVFRVAAYIRGQGKATISVTTPGGVLPDRNLMMTFPGMMTFVPGTEVMLFISKAQNGSPYVYGQVTGARQIQEVQRMITVGSPQ
jgi:hypothetical protein